MKKFKFYIGLNKNPFCDGNEKRILVTYNPDEIEGKVYEINEKTTDKLFFSYIKKLGNLRRAMAGAVK